MKPDELATTLHRLGYINQSQAAKALGARQYNLSRYLSGTRRIPARLANEVKRLEDDGNPPAALTGAMAYALGQAGGPQEPISVPEGEPEYRVVNWDATFQAMHRLGVVRHWEGKVVVTEKGWKALKDYQEGT